MGITWREWVRTPGGRGVIAFCLVTLVGMVLFMPYYYRELLGPKQGYLLDDPVLNFFTPEDWSNSVNFILGLALVQTIVMYWKEPGVILTAVLTYCLVNILRALSMYSVTLEPPADMILLIDPISALFVYPDEAFAKDLFFSGHVSTMMAMVFVERNRLWFWTKAGGTALMSLFLAWQHVHYTVDLVVAPIVAYLAYLGARRVIRTVSIQKTAGISQE
jgi:hypothetical protein